MGRPARRDLVTALGAMVRDGAANDVARRHTHELIDVARHHDLELASLDLLHGADELPKSLVARREALTRRALTQRLVTARTIAALRDALDDRFVVVKGPIAAQRWWRNPNHRTYRDIDVVVAPSTFGNVVETLEANGFAPLLRNWHGFARYGVGEIPLAWEHCQIDLHWDLVALARDRRAIRFAVEDLLERSVPVDIGGTVVRTLDDDDAVLHMCVNAGLDGGRGLRGLLEIDRAVRDDRVDGEQFLAGARSVGAHALCAAVLQRCHRLLDTPVPEGWLNELEPWPGWTLTNGAVDRVSRYVPGMSSTASGVWLSAGRSTRARTVAAAWRDGRGAVRTRIGGSNLTGPGGALDWQRAAGDDGVEATARRDYLAWVDRGRHLEVVRVDADTFERLLHAHEPRASAMIGAARDGVPSGRARALLVRRPDGSVAAAITTYRWTVGRTTAYPLVLDPAAAVTVAELIDRLGATDLAGFDDDVTPLRPLLSRWRDSTPATAASLPPGFEWGEPRPTTRRARRSDVDGVTDLIWHHAPHGFPNRRLLKQRVRRAVDDLVIVIERESPPRIVGIAARDSKTASYHCWALIAIEPPWRGEGLSWDLVAHGAAEAAAERAGAICFVVASNPMPIPDDARVPATWWYVDLASPERVAGERYVRIAIDHVLAAPARRRGSRPHGAFRQPGADDELVSAERTQRDWTS